MGNQDQDLLDFQGCAGSTLLVFSKVTTYVKIHWGANLECRLLDNLIFSLDSLEVWPRNSQSKVSFTLCSVYPLLPEPPAQASSGSSRSLDLRWARLGNTLAPRSDCVVWAISAVQWDLGPLPPTAPSLLISASPSSGAQVYQVGHTC